MIEGKSGIGRDFVVDGQRSIVTDGNVNDER